MSRNLLIIGANGHGKVVADIAIKLNRYQYIHFLDDDENIKECMGMPVIGGTDDLQKYINDYDIFVAVGNVLIRKRIMEKLLEIGANIPCLIHPNAVIGTNVVIEKGTVIMAGTVINPDTRIGMGCIVNTGATIDHDCVIGNYVHVSVGSHLAGTVTVGDNTWIGIGAIISNNISVANDIFVGAGCVVVKSISKQGTYFGVPAKKIK